VSRDYTGKILRIQGPVYAGGGFTPTTLAVFKGLTILKPLVDKYPDLVNDISTGASHVDST
jgi:hypothetical protein